MKRNNAIGLLVLAAVATLIAVTTIQAREKDDLQTAQEIPDTLMIQKLQHAQELLSALSLGDFDGMITHARELQRISLEARWSQPHSSAYAGYGDDFRNALDRIVIAAGKQNIDGAALNYVQVVLTCVQCHKSVRDGEALARGADFDDLGLLNLVAAAGD